MDEGRPPRRAASGAPVPPGFRSRLLEGLTPSQIRAVLAGARRQRVSRNEVLQHEGEPASHLSLLVTGLAAFYTATFEGDKLFLRWITPGDAFGLAALQNQPQPYLATVQTLQESSVLLWERMSAHALFSQVPRLRENLYAVASDYMARLAHVLVSRTSQTAEQRLARMLVESAHQIGRAGREGIALDLTNELLAEAADVSVFTASRQLSEWHRQGILAKSRGKILLRAPKRLVSLLAGHRP